MAARRAGEPFLDSVFGLGPFLIPISAIVIGGVIDIMTEASDPLA
jgi:hypothetical protein